MAPGNSNPERSDNSSIANSRLVLPYFGPYFAYVAIATFGEKLPLEVNYSLRLLIVSAILWWGWRWYVPLKGQGNIWVSIGSGIIVGLLGMMAWILLIKPFASPSNVTWSYSAFSLRLISATILVPLFEELLMRGYILRLAYQWDTLRAKGQKEAFHSAFFEDSIDDVKQGAWSFPAVAVSTVAFMLGHQLHEWPAACVYGLLMCLLYIKRKDLVSCIAAHATTNLSLGGYVYLTGQWQYW